MKIEETSHLQEHLSEFNNLISNLKSVQVEIDDEKYAILLCSMPDSWDGLIMNLGDLCTEESLRKSYSGNSCKVMLI